MNDRAIEALSADVRDCDTKQSLRILCALIEMRDGRLIKSRGICANLEALGITGMGDTSAVKQAIKSWPEASGDSMFPVPHPRLDPVVAFNRCDKWTRWTRYGRARRRLLAYIIEYFEERV